MPVFERMKVCYPDWWLDIYGPEDLSDDDPDEYGYLSDEYDGDDLEYQNEDEYVEDEP